MRRNARRDGTVPGRQKRPTRQERYRQELVREASKRLERLRSEPTPAPFLSGDTERKHAPGDLYALHFEHDMETFVAVVGEVLGHGFSNYPVLAIYRGDPYRIWTFDVYQRGEILVGRRSVLSEVEWGHERAPGGCGGYIGRGMPLGGSGGGFQSRALSWQAQAASHTGVLSFGLLSIQGQQQ
jgi:hypothetical protein